MDYTDARGGLPLTIAGAPDGDSRTVPYGGMTTAPPSMTSISVITPTIGRARLAATAESVLSQLGPDDEWIVVADAERKDARGLLWNAAWPAAENGRARFTWSYSRENGSVYGNAQRDHALSLVRTSHVCFLDDDDVYEPGTLDLFREWAHDAPEAVHVGRMMFGQGHHAHGLTLWRDPEWREQNVGTPMVLYPSSRTLPSWMDFNHLGFVSDFGWMTAARGDAETIWHEDVVAEVRPHA